MCTGERNALCSTEVGHMEAAGPIRHPQHTEPDQAHSTDHARPFGTVLCCAQVNATPFAARRWATWRQQILLGIHKILKEAKASIAPSAADIFHDDPVFAEQMATLKNGQPL